MARYIMIDSDSGYVFGDTANFNGVAYDPTSPIDACREMEEKIVGRADHTYEEVSRLDGESGYLVYRADTDAGEAIAVVENGQDPETIRSVENHCRLVATVRIVHFHEAGA